MTKITADQLSHIAIKQKVVELSEWLKERKENIYTQLQEAAKRGDFTRELYFEKMNSILMSGFFDSLRTDGFEVEITPVSNSLVTVKISWFPS